MKQMLCGVGSFGPLDGSRTGTSPLSGELWTIQTLAPGGRLDLSSSGSIRYETGQSRFTIPMGRLSVINTRRRWRTGWACCHPSPWGS